MESLKLEKGSLLEENAALKREVQALDKKAVCFTGKKMVPFFPLDHSGRPDHTVLKNGISPLREPKAQDKPRSKNRV